MNFREFYREPGIVFWAILFPVLLAIGLGFAFSENSTLEKSTVIINRDDLAVEFKSLNQKSINVGSDELGFTKFHLEDAAWDEAVSMVKKGKINIILEAKNDSILYHFDPSNPEAKLAYLQIKEYIDSKPEEAMRGSISKMTQKGTRYIDFLLPGLLAMGIMMNCMWGDLFSFR